MTLIRKTGVMVLLMALSIGLSGCSYNRFVSQEEAIKAQWAQVENQLQRRNDLIPNLVEATKGFAQQERDVFQSIADSRAKLAGATTPEQKIAAANEQSSALSRLLVVVENYPILKSNETFARLMDELAGTENRIAVERMRYNETSRRTTGRGGNSRPILRPASSASRATTPCSRPRNRPKWRQKSIFPSQRPNEM